MTYNDTLDIVHSCWINSDQTVFTVFDTDFTQVPALLNLLHLSGLKGLKTPFARLRYIAFSEGSDLPETVLGSQFTATPGWHFVNLSQFNAELHVWIGSNQAGLNEYQGQFDIVLQPSGLHFKEDKITKNSITRTLPKGVAIVGAGIAGSSVAWELCQRQIPVHLYDSASEPATGASGNWVGAFHPHISRGDSHLSKLSRLGFEHTLQALEKLSNLGFLVHGEDWGTPGHLQTIPDHASEKTRETLAQLSFPEKMVRWAEPNSLISSQLGGLYFSTGGWVKPAHWVKANLKACGNLLTTHYQCTVNNIDILLKEHSLVVICCAEQSIQLAPIDGARVSSVKGQISKLSSIKHLQLVLSGESYAIAPPFENWMVLGSTYERPVLNLHPTKQADEDNIIRFNRSFPNWPLGEIIDHRCAVRSVWHDRLPAIGPVPNLPGVFMSTGFASRGLLWAALAGWIISNHCLGLPFDSLLLRKIMPRGANKVRSKTNCTLRNDFI
jgi:tRNA 5-methylaminomethyl-2-thiouridine biosynthesis bifunctional protein